MNWYRLFKKSDMTTETMPYFQEFADYGDYVPDQEKIHNQLLGRFGLSIVGNLGCGDNGCAYDLSNGDVLKVTTNDKEGQQAKWLSSHKNPAIADIRHVWKDGDLFYIIVEKVEPITPQYANTIDRARTFMQRRNIPLGEISDLTPEQFSDLPIGKDIVDYIRFLSTMPLEPHDYLNRNNVGLKNGKLKFFDIT